MKNNKLSKSNSVKDKPKLKNNRKKEKVNKNKNIKIKTPTIKNEDVSESGLKSSQERWILLGWVIVAVCVPLLLMFFR